MTVFEIAIALGVLVCGVVTYRALRDSGRLDALQKNAWQVGCIDGHFAVIAGTPPVMVGGMHADVRKAIDAAVESKNG